jgi:hypothetical protein
VRGACSCVRVWVRLRRQLALNINPMYSGTWFKMGYCAMQVD